MPNWCWNHISIENSKSPELLKELYTDLKQAEGEEEGTILGHTEFLRRTDCHYLFNIAVEEETFSFETKWSAPLYELKKMAQYYKCDFELEFEEPGCGYFGKAIIPAEGDGIKVGLLDDDVIPDYEREDFYEVINNLVNKLELETRTDL